MHATTPGKDHTIYSRFFRGMSPMGRGRCCEICSISVCTAGSHHGFALARQWSNTGLGGHAHACACTRTHKALAKGIFNSANRFLDHISDAYGGLHPGVYEWVESVLLVADMDLDSYYDDNEVHGRGRRDAAYC